MAAEIASRARGAVEQTREVRVAMKFGAGFQQQEAVTRIRDFKIGTFDSKANGLILLADPACLFGIGDHIHGWKRSEIDIAGSPRPSPVRPVGISALEGESRR